MLPSDHPAAIPETANERWTLLQENSLEALIFYIFGPSPLFSLALSSPKFFLLPLSRHYCYCFVLYLILFIEGCEPHGQSLFAYSPS